MLVNWSAAGKLDFPPPRDDRTLHAVVVAICLIVPRGKELVVVANGER